ncbi:group II intron reverse transcriptase/maturase [Flammeovirga sp. SJP92]|nr:group II intron reverse transcriptase/maturase [Flammeovirga sp. SJP92]KXX69330.1 group II intron reverse transcriptase/maturase [Flammeovirga sp. SJP92]KXX69448.1 group II intron reverse transcriptase/maturase [Flammeovirga sp. SJP92]KXX71362.1 group II intron reverse transcriptase/maturase [Flammeovirga sp. SJP92]
MIEQVVSKVNMKRAYQRVYRNGGSAGIDKMSVAQLFFHLQKTWDDTKTSLLSGQYLPQPIKGVEIPKPNGKTRLLGIPTVQDRLTQQALHQVLSPIFEKEFSAFSFGFRPNKSAHDALQTSLSYINEGYQHIIDIDLKSFFDEVDHSILLQLIYQRIKCPTTMKLIRKFLRAPIMIQGKLKKRRKGVPQGGPLSPLLSNILLHELDLFLMERGVRFVRYADDFSIYVKSEKAAKRVGNNVYVFLRDILKLPINREKSGKRRPLDFEVLGYAFVSSYKKGSKGQYQLVAKRDSWKKLKTSLKEVTRKTTPMSFDERIKKLLEIQRGWVNYFSLGNIKRKLKKVDEWVRNRLRYCIWQHWKKVERKRKNLMRLGISYDQAYAWSRTRKGGWAVAQSPILITTITLERLEKRGYISMLDIYRKLAER